MQIKNELLDLMEKNVGANNNKVRIISPHVELSISIDSRHTLGAVSAQNFI